MDDTTAALDAIGARVRGCATYNFGMRDANTLAHHDAPLLLGLARKQHSALEAVCDAISNAAAFGENLDPDNVLSVIRDALGPVE